MEIMNSSHLLVGRNGLGIEARKV